MPIMPITIAISNQKGGVGKTTSSMNIGARLAMEGYKTLLIDLDPQENLSKAWGVAANTRNIYSLILGDVDHQGAIHTLKSSVAEGQPLDIIPGTSNFSRYEKLRAGEVNAQFDLKKVLQPIIPSYDFIILDCPPALGLITVNAFACAHYVLIPVEAQLFAMEGLDSIRETIQKIREFINPHLDLLGVFLVRHNKRTILNKEVAQLMEKEYAGQLLKTTIRENIALKESPHEGKDIFAYAPKSNGAKDYELLTQEIINRLWGKK